MAWRPEATVWRRCCETGLASRPSVALAVVEHVHDLHLGQVCALEALVEFHQAILAVEGLVVGVYGGCGAAKQGLGAVHVGEHDGGVAGVVSRCGVVLLVAGLVFFVDYHQAYLGEGEEDGGPHAEDYHRLVAGEDAVPQVYALGVGELGVVDEQAVAEDFAQAVGELGSEADFGHEV